MIALGRAALSGGVITGDAPLPPAAPQWAGGPAAETLAGRRGPGLALRRRTLVQREPGCVPLPAVTFVLMVLTGPFRNTPAAVRPTGPSHFPSAPMSLAEIKRSARGGRLEVNSLAATF